MGSKRLFVGLVLVGCVGEDKPPFGSDSAPEFNPDDTGPTSGAAIPDGHGSYGSSIAVGPFGAADAPEIAGGDPTEDGFLSVYRAASDGESAAEAWLVVEGTSGSGMELGSALDGIPGQGLIAGAPGYDLDEDSTDNGAVYLLTSGDAPIAGFVEEVGGEPLIGFAGSRFGEAVLGDVLTESGSEAIAVGAPSDQGGDGAVYLVSAGATGPVEALLGESQAWAAYGADGSAGALGTSLARADVDGDGLPDLIVGAPGSGMVYVFAGDQPLGSVEDAILVIEAPPEATGAGFGTSVASDDFSGDGYADVLIGAPDGNVAYLYTFDGDLAPSSTTTFVPPEGAEGLGTGLGSAGDLDDDGRAEVALGAPYPDNGPGRAWVYGDTFTSTATVDLGGSGAYPPPPLGVSGFIGDETSDHFGWKIVGSGNFGGDPLILDVLVSAPGISKIFVYYDVTLH